jgi:galactoside O-acetyltransferase
MAYLPLRTLPALPDAPIAERWLERIAGALSDPDCDRALLCRETLAELLVPQYAAHWEEAVQDERLPLGTRLLLESLDPRNVTLEPEYYGECDDARFQRVKPLLWLW